jgi:DNA helicase HerA-like ATPase
MAMFGGGDYAEVARWLQNFVVCHAKRVNARVEGVVDATGAREGRSYGVRLRLGDRLLPPADEAPVELAYGDVASDRGSLAWCGELAARVRSLAGGFVGASQGSRQSA